MSTDKKVVVTFSVDADFKDRITDAMRKYNSLSTTVSKFSNMSVFVSIAVERLIKNIDEGNVS